MKLDNAYSNPLYYEVGELPSRYKPYTQRYLGEKSFTKLYARRFNIDELFLLSKAHVLKDKSYLLRAIDLVIDQPIELIAIPDLYYIMMWIRAISYPESPYVINWECQSKLLTHESGTYIPLELTNSKNITDVKSIQNVNVNDYQDGVMLYDAYTDIAYVKKDGVFNKYEWADCGTLNTQTISNKTVSLLMLDENVEELGEHFDYPRVSCLIELEQAMTDPSLALVAPQLQWIKGSTLAEKTAYLKSLNDLSVFDQAGALTKVNGFGVSENITLVCRKCGVVHNQKLDINLLNFFQ